MNLSEAVKDNGRARNNLLGVLIFIDFATLYAFIYDFANNRTIPNCKYLPVNYALSTDWEPIPNNDFIIEGFGIQKEIKPKEIP